MSIRSDYQRLRHETMLFNNKIIKQIGQPYLERSARLLDLLDEDDNGKKVFVLESVQEQDTMFHFALFDVCIDGRTAHETLALGDELTERERELLSIYGATSWRPYKVKAIESNSSKIHLVDLITDQLVTIIDFAMSQNPDVINELIVLRYYDFGKQRFTTGVSFPFYKQQAEELINIFEEEPDDDDLTEGEYLFTELYDFYALMGMGIRYEDVSAPRRKRKKSGTE